MARVQIPPGALKFNWVRVMSFEFNIVIAFIGFVIGFVIEKITGIDLIKLFKALGLITFLFPVILMMNSMMNDPNPETIGNFVTMYMNNLVIFIINGLPGMVAGAFFSALTEKEM